MNIMRSITAAGAFAALLSLGACDLDLQDPNLPVQEVVTGTAEGVKSMAVGLQAEYANELVDPVYVVGLVTEELGAGGATFQGYQQADRGEPVENNLDVSEGPWAAMYDVVLISNLLLEHAPQVPLEPGTRSGIIAMAKLFKGLAFGQLLQIFERIPLDVGLDNLAPQFATRDEAIAETLRLLEEARQEIQTTPPSSEFDTQIEAPGFELEQTIDAMIARFNLLFGRYAEALAAAQRVDPDVLSEFEYTATDPNPLWGMWYSSGNAYQMRPQDSFRLEAEPGDDRVEYWVTPATITGAVHPLDLHDKYRSRDDDYPAYLPDEMLLIRAEVHARQGDLLQALSLVNQVRTQCSSDLDEPVACLPPLTLVDVPTRDAMLAEILRQRRYELYLQAVRWSDLRRFGLPVQYRFMMVPRSECDRNPNAPRELCALETPPAS